ncbi:trehalose/maltose binding protein (malE) related protein [Thermoplasma acidophilum]|uniref:Trehalose/maltose binding protein (MalE) related protein n=1 Tax=Thermoplasma acidophilum (strain ATCC 25905 / DSM 1728 / JCM 9062 / NBRC 15155 / AMRC-C165) TaxID=273075 RepID=Q9HLU9_THEAC|nr:trehalose/maltose-binding protein (malE) [Thermoplasma acidophilum]MCY0851962.1 hypothetical protein [Thermoplasma acidophilum]CAC11273.1 trehalose/maltose binding protein (malE) related protein [Thermoplasma acidophilum]
MDSSNDDKNKGTSYQPPSGGGYKPPSSGKKNRKLVWAVVAVVVIVVVATVSVEAYYSNKAAHTITIWSSQSAGGETQVFDQAVKAFEAKYPNITLQIDTAVAVGSASTYLTAAHAGKAPNVYRDTSDDAAVLWASGSLINMSDEFNSSYFSQFEPAALNDWTYHGSIYGIPININGNALYYNKMYVKTPPKTIYQLIQDAKSVTGEKAPNGKTVYGFPYGLGLWYGYNAAAWFPAFNATIFNSSMYPQLNSVNSTKTIGFLYNLTYYYKVSPTGLSSQTDVISMFEDNESAFIEEGPWEQSTFESYLGSNLGVAPLPFNNATGSWVEPIWGSIGYVVSNSKASGANPTQIWASIQFVKMMTNVTNQELLFKEAGDFPSAIAANNWAISHNSTDPYAQYWFDQEAHTQIQPNYLAFNAYWTPFNTQMYALYVGGSGNITQAATALENQIIATMKSAGYPPFISATTISLLQVSSASENLYFFAESSVSGIKL